MSGRRTAPAALPAALGLPNEKSLMPRSLPWRRKQLGDLTLRVEYASSALRPHGPLDPRSDLLRVAAAGRRGAPETHAYVATLNTGHERRPRARRARPSSTSRRARRTYGQLVGRLDMPERRRRAAPLRLERLLVGAVPVGAAPARRAPLPARARPALLAHPRRRRQGRPARARSSSRSSRPRRSPRKAGYSRPHTIHCGPDGIYVSALGNPEGDGPGGDLPARPRRLLGQGRLGGRPRPAGAGLRLLVAPRLRHRDHQRVGHAEHGRGRPAASCCSATSTATSCTSGTSRSARHMQEIDLGAEHQMVLELRPAHDPRKAYGFVGVVASTADLSPRSGSGSATTTARSRPRRSSRSRRSRPRPSSSRRC